MDDKHIYRNKYNISSHFFLYYKKTAQQNSIRKNAILQNKKNAFRYETLILYNPNLSYNKFSNLRSQEYRYILGKTFSLVMQCLNNMKFKV